jgi:hypothetical protein
MARGTRRAPDGEATRLESEPARRAARDATGWVFSCVDG